MKNHDNMVSVDPSKNEEDAVDQDNEIDGEEDEEMEDDDLNNREFQDLDKKLNELNESLDNIEKWRDNIHEQCLELLNSLKAARESQSSKEQDCNLPSDKNVN